MCIKEDETKRRINMLGYENEEELIELIDPDIDGAGGIPNIPTIPVLPIWITKVLCPTSSCTNSCR